MNVDEIISSLSDTDRETLLARLEAEVRKQPGQQLEDRVARLEEHYGSHAAERRSTRQRSGADWACGGPSCHMHHHCHMCGW